MKLPSAAPRLLQTTAVRLALRYVVAYALVLGALLAGLVAFSRAVVDPRIAPELEREYRELVQAAADGALPAALEQRLPAALADGRYYAWTAPDGTPRAGNLRAWPIDDPPALDGRVHVTLLEEELFAAGSFDEDARLPAIAGALPDGSRLLLARRVEQATHLEEVTEFLAQGLAIFAVLSLALGITLGRGILQRMDAISRSAGRIMAGDLSQRVPVSDRDDEFDALAARLNAMLDRIQQLVRGMRDVTDNIAHDLRNPLARLRNRLEVTLLEPRTPDEYRQVIAGCIEDAGALLQTFNALLDIAQAEAGSRRTPWEALDLAALARDVAELYAPLAEDNGQVLTVQADQPAPIDGSRHLLGQALGNLVENAMKYAPPDAKIEVAVRREGATVEVSVRDDGPGIAEADCERVLERFVRLESARSVPGNGLGLSLVQAVCRLHGASLALADADPGLCITLRFAAAKH